MKTTPVAPEDLRGVFAVPPLARRDDPGQPIDLDENERLLGHMVRGGLRRFLYGGNALLHHVTMADYEDLLGWLSGRPGDLWVIPSAGPSFGRAIDQARILCRYPFPCVMMLPCSDPRDATGLEDGLRRIVQAAGMPVIVYLSAEDSFGPEPVAGLEAIARLVESGDCVAVKYAVVREDPGDDAYLSELLRRVDVSRVVGGIGERPAIVHLRHWRLAGYTTGSGTLAPRLTGALFDACDRGDYKRAEALRAAFIPLEDLRDAWGPSRVLHHAVALSGVAETGPITPFIAGLDTARLQQLEPVARALVEHDTSFEDGG